MKQMSFIGHETSAGAKKYTTAAGSPIYTPKDRRPHILELRDNSRAQTLLRAIDD